MNTEKIYLVAGGDTRFLKLSELLSPKGKVYLLGFDEKNEIPKGVTYLKTISEMKEQPDCVVLPMPVTKDGVKLYTPLCNEEIRLNYIFDLCHRNTLVFGGKIGDELIKELKIRKLNFVDYIKREEFAIMNAVPTAEGALSIVLNELPFVLMGRKVLITGFGRISKVLLKYFTALDAVATVTARKYKDLVWAEIYGADTVLLEKLSEKSAEYDVVINTVPSMILGEDLLKTLKKDCLIIDLASTPGGVDFMVAEELGLKVIWALSLPGKTAPVTAASALLKTLLNCVREYERGELVE